MQTPTLAMLAERQTKIQNFVKEPYYKVELSGAGVVAVSEQMVQEQDADTVQAACDSQCAVVGSIERKRVEKKPPKLYDLTTLQREVNRYYGLTASQTLQAVQELYEEKLVTYPRTDSQFVTEDMRTTVESLVQTLDGKTVDVSCVINNNKVTDHHAILPTMQGAKCDKEKLSETKQKIRLFEGIKYVLPILHPNKKRLALIMCPEEDSASVEWARQKDANWVNKDITSLEFVENIFKLMNWNRECRYKVLGRVANSDQGLCMLFDLEEAIMFTPKPQEYTDPLTGEMKKKQIKFFPDVYKDRIGKSYNDYIAGHQMNLFEDFIGYQGSAVLDEPEQKTDTISVPIPQCEESENIPLPDLSEQPENVQRPGSEVVEKGMLT